jgi:nucleoside-diphosphate kinase
LTIIKPDAVAERHVGEIIAMIERSGFDIVAARMVTLTKDLAARFYEIHEGKDFFEGLIEYASSGPIFVMVLKKENCVEDLRKLVGSTDPAKAEEGTIRHKFGKTIRKNAIHASDGSDTAQREIKFFFPEMDILLTY